MRGLPIGANHERLHTSIRSDDMGDNLVAVDLGTLAALEELNMRFLHPESQD